MRLQGRIALVTGAASGIGAAIARRLAADGATVFVHTRRNRAGADAVAQEIRHQGGRADVLMGDLTDGDRAAHLIQDCFGRYGALDILVLNAGGGKGGLAVNQSTTDIDSVLALNLRATILAASEFARLRVKGGLYASVSR